MKALAGLIAVLALAGCGEPNAPEPAPVTTVANTASRQPIPIPTFAGESRLGIFRRPGNLVRVGMGYDDGLGVFAEPPNAYAITDLPPSVAEPFDARGWQGKGEGFGTILYKGRIVAAIHEVTGARDERVAEVLANYRAQFGDAQTFAPDFTPAIVEGKYAHYWFWQSGAAGQPGDQLLMLCASEVQPGKISITEAVGWSPIMEALGMTPQAASRDQARADRLIEKFRTRGRPNSSNSSNRPGG